MKIIYIVIPITSVNRKENKYTIMNDQTSDYFAGNFINLTTNLIYSLYPLNKLAKILYLAPRKHNPNHDCLDFAQKNYPQFKLEKSPSKSMFSILQNFFLPPISTSTKTTTKMTTRRPTTTTTPNLSPRTNSFNKRSRLPHVTKSDLLNINQIHAASLNGIAGQLSQQNNLNNNQNQPILPQLQPQQPLDNNQLQTQVIGEQQTRKPSQSSNVGQFAPASAPASIPAPVVELTPTQIQSSQQPSQFRLRPTTTSGSSTGNQAFASSGSQPSPTNLNPSSGMVMNNRQQQQISSSAQNKFPFLNNQAAPNQQQVGGSMSTMATSTSLPSATSTTSAIANSPQNNQIGAYESTPLAATNSISVHSSNQANQQSLNPLLASSQSTTSTTTTMASVSNSGAAHNTNNNNNHHSSVLASFSTPIRSHNTLASAKYSLDGIIAVAIFGGFIFLGAIITIIVIIIRR